MKKIFLSFMLLAVGCMQIFAQDKIKIEPSGNIITKEIPVQAFDAINAKGLYELVLQQGEKETVKIEADDNLMDFFSVKNNGTALEIDMPKLKDKNIDFKQKDDKKSLKLKVYVTFKKLKSLDLSVIGNVRCEAIVKADEFNIDSKSVGNVDLKVNAGKLTIDNKGVGNITLSGNANNAEVSNKGVGEFDGADLVVQTMNINNTGVGNANVNVIKDLTIRQSFLGKVNNKGAAKTHKMEGVEM